MGGVYTRVTNVASLRPGDHIAIWDYSRWPLGYQHHGIVWVSGETPETIQVCHVWSPLEDTAAAQSDSCFRISTLKEFLYKRKLIYLRLVEYHTSAVRDVLSRWGEVHLSKSDLPEVVLSRCKFLLGLGRGEFNIFNQNCEHAAHWCKTGEQWCKQSLTKAKGRVPFESQLSKEEVDNLYREIEELKELSKSVVERVLKLSGTLVYLRVNGNHYAKVLDDGRVVIVPQGEDPETCGRTAFRLECFSKVYNCVKVSFHHEESDRHMFSRSTLSCFRDLRVKKANCVRGASGMRWEYSTMGFLKSMNQHRRYVGVRPGDNVLIDVSMRGDAARVEFVAVTTPMDSDYQPPDIDMVTRKYNHRESITKMESRSMKEVQQSFTQKQQAASL